MEFMGWSLIATGLIIIVISLLNYRHSPGSKSMEALRTGMRDERIHKISASRPPRAVAKLGVCFGLFFIVVGLVGIALVKWVWWGI